jgi:hypothetical protein
MPPVTKGQSGQVYNDRSLSVPQLSASVTADGFESANLRGVVHFMSYVTIVPIHKGW